MSNELVSDAEVELALNFLRDKAGEIAEAKRQAVKSDHMLRHIKAVAMKLHAELGVGAQEREAYASAAYVQGIDNCADAAAKLEEAKALREAAALKIEVWRSASANYRAMKI